MNAIDPGNRTAPSRLKSFKMLLLALVVAIVLVAAGYLSASLQAGGRLALQKTEHEQAVLALQNDLTAARQALASSTLRNHFLAASASLYRASADLDDRNFGTANEHLQQAADAMAKAAANGDGADPEIARLSTVLGQMNINVATDLAAQRSSVMQLAAQVDSLAQAAE